MGIVKTAGLLSVAALAPNALQLLKYTKSSNQRSKTRGINSARNRLVKKGLLRYENGFLEITPTGQDELAKIERSNYKLPRQKKWDKHWRILIFDIKEERKNTREKLRDTLVSLGFKRLQDSVWIYPYDCEDFITLLKADFKIGKDLLYIIAEHIEYDKPLKEFFGL